MNIISKVAAVGAVALGALVAPSVAPAEAAISVRVVMVGDSIGAQVYPYVTTSLSTHIDGEPSRSPYDTGAEGRASTVQALATLQRLVPNSVSGTPTYIVVQEGATGTKDGTYITNAEWTSFIYDVLKWTAGRCLIFVMPGYGHTINGVADESHNDIAYARTIIAMDIFDAYSHRCIYEVNWWSAANGNASYLQADGLHPSTAGRNWIAGQISAVLP